jgi:hypothetical protein
MPAIARFSNCTIYVYSDDRHKLPHFHVLGPDCSVTVNLETLEVMVGKGPRPALQEAIDWARDNRDRLFEAWRTLNERD